MSGRLVLLGTGTCDLQSGRTASSVLVDLPRARFVFDFGRGVARRLAELGIRQDQLQTVILSHYHPDHFSDLIPFIHAALHSPSDPRTLNLHVYGPEGLEETMERVLALAGFNDDESSPFRIELRRLDRSLRVEGFEVISSSLPPAENRGIRFEHGGRVCALTGDSHFHDEEVAFLKGVDLAVIDAGHLSDAEIVELAVRAQPERIVCSHLYRPLDEAKLSHEARELGFLGHLTVGRDLLELCL